MKKRLRIKKRRLQELVVILTILLFGLIIFTDQKKKEIVSKDYIGASGNQTIDLAKGSYSIQVVNNTNHDVAGNINRINDSYYYLKPKTSKVVTMSLKKDLAGIPLNADNNVFFSFRTHKAGGNLGVLTDNKEFYGTSNGDDQSISYYTFKAGRTGYLLGNIESVGNETNDFSIKICDDHSESLTGGWAVRDASDHSISNVGVEQGKTYKVAVKTSNNAYKLDLRVIGRGFTGGERRSQALTMQPRRAYQGLILAGNSPRWFKVRETSTRRLLIRVSQKMFKNDAQKNGIRVDVFAGGKRISIDKTSYDYKANVLTVTYSYSKGKAQKGDYYFRVSGYGNSTGYYNIKTY